VNSITRYIAVQLAGPLLFITLTLTGVVWLTQSLRFVDFIINRGLSVSGFLSLTLMLLPGFLAIILPVATFCGVLFAYNRLEGDSELLVMRATGLSDRRLAQPALMVAGVMVLILYLVTLYLMPIGFRNFKDLQFIIRNSQAAVLLQEGAFNTVVSGVTVYVRERRGGGELRGLLVHDTRVAEKPVTMMAESGILTLTPEGPRFIMLNGNRQEVERDRGQLSLLYFERYVLDLGSITAAPATRWRESGERFLHELFDPGSSVDDVKNADAFRAEAHRRIVLPWYALALTAIALIVVLDGEFSRRGRWPRLVAGAAAGLVFEVIGVALVSLVGRNPALAPLFYLHVLVPLVALGWVWMRRPAALPAMQPAGAG